MDHIQFKANETAAGYVADGLDESTQEAFELHLMGCRECVGDVEIWRAIKLDMPKPRPAVKMPARIRRPATFGDWRIAASLVGAGVVGATGGWVGKTTQTPDIDSTQTVVFNLASITRGGECTTLRLATDTRLAMLRVPGLTRDVRVVALDSDKHELPGGQYATRVQPDGSQLVRLDSQSVAGREVQLEARHADGSSEPLGCVAGEKS
jgi:hypothetical protein